MAEKPIKAATKARSPQKGEKTERRKRKQADFILSREKRGVVYLSGLPNEFLEEQMWRYFSQFGLVTRIKLARYPKSGQSRGYAFIEFQNTRLAQRVTDSMDKYVLLDKTLKARFVSAAEQSPFLFDGPSVKTEKDFEIYKKNMMVESCSKGVKKSKNLNVKCRAILSVTDRKEQLKVMGLDVPVANSSVEDSNREEAAEMPECSESLQDLSGNSSNDESDDCEEVMEIDDSDQEIEDEGPIPQLLQKRHKSGVTGLNDDVNFIEAKMLKETLKRWHNPNAIIKQAKGPPSEFKVERVKQDKNAGKSLPEKETARQQNLSAKLARQKSLNSSKSLKLQRRTSQYLRSKAFGRKAIIFSRSFYKSKKLKTKEV